MSRRAHLGAEFRLGSSYVEVLQMLLQSYGLSLDSGWSGLCGWLLRRTRAPLPPCQQRQTVKALHDAFHSALFSLCSDPTLLPLQLYLVVHSPF